MEKSVSVNNFIGSLPRIVRKNIWIVTDENGSPVQCVSATDNRESTAQAYINSKYPGRKMTLAFNRFGDFITIPR